jgi:hypothetical protein
MHEKNIGLVTTCYGELSSPTNVPVATVTIDSAERVNMRTRAELKAWSSRHITRIDSVDWGAGELHAWPRCLGTGRVWAFDFRHMHGPRSLAQ